MMEKKIIQEIVFSYFNKVNPKLKKIDLEEDYFASGYIDSFGAIEMICFMEEKFKIKFSTEDMENPDFKIVDGLITFIFLKIKKKK